LSPEQQARVQAALREKLSPQGEQAWLARELRAIANYLRSAVADPMTDAIEAIARAGVVDA
jgi:hypothetical protein